VDVSLSAALLGVTALAVYVLYLGGRSLANEFGGSALVRALHGLKIAPAYAVLFLLVSIILAASPIRIDEGTIRTAPMGAFLWPLVIAAFAGAAGGVMTAKEEIAARWAWGRRGVAVVVAGWRMLLAGLVLSFVGLLVLAIAKPDDSKVYFAGLRNAGEEGGVVAAVHNVLLFPNESVLVLVPAMGACDGVYGGFFSFDLLCYTNFPKGSAPPSGAQPTVANPLAGLSGFLPKSGTAPIGYFLFLLVPLLATLWGGRFAARGAESRGEALALGAASGVVFAILVAGAAILAGISIGVSGGIAGFGLGGALSAGPQVATGGLLALLWGAGGGSLGALTLSRSAGEVVPEGMPPGG